MFTGIILAVGKIRSIEPKGADCRLRIDVGKLPMSDVALGDSIATNGVCLTVIEFDASSFVADVSAESLRLTTLGELKVGSPVNLELAMTPSTRLGGHIVSGHVDGVGTVTQRFPEGRSERFVIRVPDQLRRYIATKGSICVNGISLTVNSVDGADFGLNIVPHTLVETSLGECKVGSRVNIEVDVIARYLESLLQGGAATTDGAGVTEMLLADSGFIRS